MESLLASGCHDVHWGCVDEMIRAHARGLCDVPEAGEMSC